MPLYVYKCKNCEHQFEARQRFSDEPLTDCPQCGSEIRRVISTVGVVFKGSGFYVTDSRNGKKSALVNGSAPASSSDDKSDKSEKPEKSEKKSDESPCTAATASKTESKTAAKSAEAAA